MGRKSRSPTSALSLIGQKVCLLLTNYEVPSALETLGTGKSVSMKPPTSPLISRCRLIQPPWQQSLTAQMVLNREDKVVQNFSAFCPSNSLRTLEAPTTLLKPTKLCPSRKGKAHVDLPSPILPNAAKMREKIC